MAHIEKLAQTVKYNEWRVDRKVKLPEYMEDLPKNSRDLVIALEDRDRAIVTRINWLIDRAAGWFGEIWCEGQDFDIVMAAEDTYYQCTVWSNASGDCSNGEYHGATPDITNDHIVIEKDGKYYVRWHVAAYSGNKTEYEFEVFKNNGATGFPQTENYRTTATASAVGAVSGGGICSLNEDDTVELFAERKDGGGVSKTLTIRAAVLSVFRVGEPD